MCSARGGVLGWETGYLEGIGGGWVRERKKHEKCAHMGTFLCVFCVSGESGSGWASARGHGRELRGR